MSELIALPDDQQEDENDIKDTNQQINFHDAMTLSSDWTIETIYSQINKANIDLSPEFQRRSAWDNTRKSRLIESIIIGMPIPNIVLAEKQQQKGKYIVIDGKQRLLSITEFMDEEIKLQGLDIRTDLNGLSFSQLNHDDKNLFENSTIRSTLIRNWGDENFLYIIFYRLNSGSLPLSPQELRKSLIGSKLINKIEEYMTSSQQFKNIFGEDLDKRMRDSELVLRFIAFEQNLQNYKGNFRTFLDHTTEYFEENTTSKDDELTNLFEKLNIALDLSVRVFGSNAFKKWDQSKEKYEPKINRAIFDCITRFFSEKNLTEDFIASTQNIEHSFQDICSIQKFKDAIEKSTKSTKSVHDRIDIWGKALTEKIHREYDEAARRIV